MLAADGNGLGHEAEIVGPGHYSPASVWSRSTSTACTKSLASLKFL
jgi:hypothetical protein